MIPFPRGIYILNNNFRKISKGSQGICRVFKRATGDGPGLHEVHNRQAATQAAICTRQSGSVSGPEGRVPAIRQGYRSLHSRSRAIQGTT